ncbi:MAG: TIGR04283 family arsenosugar biosynthesis glycosyltransferase [Pseudomonadota bacterium]
MPMTVCLVVPLYNEGEAVFDLIEHIDSISGIHKAVLVDASTDFESVRAFERAQISKKGLQKYSFVRLQTAGRAVQMNAGAELSAEDILLFLHCDTRLPERSCELINDQISAGYEWGRFDVCMDDSGWPFRLIAAMINIRSRMRHLATGDQAIFIRRELFAAAGCFEEIPLMEDIALSRKLRHSPAALIKVPVLTSARRWRKRGIGRTIVLMWLIRMAYWLGVDPNRLARWYGHAR